jgi:hypothetical protein
MQKRGIFDHSNDEKRWGWQKVQPQKQGKNGKFNQK